MITKEEIIRRLEYLEMVTEPIDDTITAYCLYAESVGRYDGRDDELEAIIREY